MKTYFLQSRLNACNAYNPGPVDLLMATAPVVLIGDPRPWRKFSQERLHGGIQYSAERRSIAREHERIFDRAQINANDLDLGD